MEVILLEDVSKLGEMGEIVEVSDGYGRNYLIPQGMAEPATAAKKNQIDHRLSMVEARKQRERAEAQEVLDELDGISISVPSRVSDEGTLYGSVSARDITDVLEQQGYAIEHKQVELERPLGELGIYKVPIKLASGIYAHIRVWVMAM